MRISAVIRRNGVVHTSNFTVRRFRPAHRAAILSKVATGSVTPEGLASPKASATAALGRNEPWRMPWQCVVWLNLRYRFVCFVRATVGARPDVMPVRCGCAHGR